ncbi:MAG: O-antigen ligase family protein [Cyclobacteriaceae bacterium]
MKGNLINLNSFVISYNKIRLIILVLLVASLPFYLKISNVLIGLAATLSLFNIITQKRWHALRVNKLSLLIIGYFFLEVLGLFYTEQQNLKIGIFTLDKHQSFILLPIIFLDFNVSPSARKSILLSFVVSCFIASLICIGVNLHESITLYDQVFHEWLFSHDRVSEPIGMHAVYFALYLSFCILILLDMLKEKYETLSRMQIFFVALLLVYFLVVIVALGARTVMVGLMLTILINLILYGRQMRSKNMYILAALVPFVFAVFVILNPVVKTRFMDMLKDNYDSSNYGSYFARTHIWIPGIEAIRENVLFGVGTGDHQSELNKKFLEHKYTEGVRLEFNMHNQYLQTALNLGLIGLSLLLSIFYIQVKEGLNRQDFLYLSFLLLFMLACITEAMLVVNKGTLFFIVFSYIFLNSKIREELPNVESSGPIRQTAVG